MIDLSPIRRDNLSKILHHLHFHGPKRRAQLSQELGIRLNSMNSLMEELSQKELIRALDPSRPRGAFGLENQTPWVFCINASLEGILLGAMNFDGGMAYFQHHDNTQLSPDSFVELIKAGYQNICRERGRPAIGGGVAMSGVVQNGKVVRSLQVGPWSQVELQTILHDAFDIPMVVENDSRCASFALYWFESQIFTRPKSILALTLSQGISCSICFAGQPVEGRNGAAGEVGHIPIATNGKVCHCGKKDCLETYCNNAEVLQQVNQILQGTKAITSVSQIKEQMMIFPSIATVIDNLAQNLCKVMMPIVASLDVDNLVLISEDVEYSKLTAKALNRHFDLQLIGHEAHGIEWEPKGSLSEHRVKGAGAFAIRQAFLSAGQNIPKS